MSEEEVAEVLELGSRTSRTDEETKSRHEDFNRGRAVKEAQSHCITPVSLVQFLKI